MVRALASHQCGPGSNPGFDSICGLSLLLVLSLAPRGFFPGSLVFPSPQKTNISKFQFDQESGRRRTTLWMCYLQIFIYLFIYYLFIYITTNHAITYTNLLSFGKNSVKIKKQRFRFCAFTTFVLHFLIDRVFFGFNTSSKDHHL